MPELLPVQSILFQNLLRDFQIIAPPRVPVWWMSDIIQPVALVNSQVTLEAQIDETAMQFATAGLQIAPVAGTILADTGQLPAGRYLFRTYSAWSDTLVDNAARIEHRNSANSVSIWDFKFFNLTTALPPQSTMEWAEDLAANERIRITVSNNAGAGREYNGIIWRRLLS